MPTIYRFDFDSTGTDSIQSYIDNKSIVNIPCPSFRQFDDAARELQDKVVPNDVVIFDTISSALETTRGDMMLGDNPSASLWEQHGKFFGDKQFLNTYRGAQNLTLRRIRNLIARGAYAIVLAHEMEGRDPMTEIGKMAVPLVNPAMVDDLIAACSDVFRLRLLTSPVYDGERIAIPAGKRVLYLRRTDEYTAKFHVDPDRVNPDTIPSGIIEPTMTRLVETLNKIPRCVCIYGNPGAGKTTLAASIVQVVAPNTVPKRTTHKQKTEKAS